MKDENSDNKKDKKPEKEKKDKVKITHDDYISHPRTQQFANAIT